MREIDSFARENLKGEYTKLSEPSKAMIQNVIREGRRNGLSDSDVTMLARVSAHSGIDIVFDKEATRINTSSVSRGLTPSPQGEGNTADYADGFYEASKNRIVINPESKRTAERLLIHELDHAIRKYVDKSGKQATRIYFEAIEGVDQATRDNILKTYKKTAKPGEVAAVVMDETNAYYAEQVLGNKYTLEKLLEAEPTLKDKILSFFKGASTDYADVPKLSAAAKKYYRTYKKLFDEFSARNAENNAIEPFTNKNGSYAIKNGVSDNVRTTDDNNGRDYALSDALTLLGEYDSTRKRHIESSGKDRIVRNYSEIMDFIKKSKENVPFERIHIGVVNDNTANLVKTKTGVDIKGYDFVIPSNSVYHIYDDHGNSNAEALRGQKAVDEKNIENIIETIISPDDVILVSDSTNTALRFEKMIDGQNVAITIVSTKKSTLSLKSAWIINKKSGGRTPSANANAFAGTPKANSRNSTTVIISENDDKVKRIYEKIRSEYPEIERTLTEGQATSLIGRGIEGDDLLNASDLAETILSVGGEITQDASVIVYHGTSKENADKINQTGKMYGKEDGLFFSTRGDGLVLDYGKSVIKAEIPIEKLILDDIFDSEAHLRLPVRQNTFTDIRVIKESSGKQYALDIDLDDGNISGADVMGWLNNKPKSDGKLDLEAMVERGLPYKKGKSDMTVGEIRKVIANTTHEKVYSKADALKAVNKLSGTWGLTVKARDEIADTIWQFLNDAPDIEYRQDMAHDIAEYIVAKVLMDSKTENPDALEAAERLSYMRSGIGKLSFTDEDIAELRHAVDEKGLKRLMGRWGFKGTKKAEETLARELRDVEAERSKLRAEYESDLVYNEKTVEKKLYDKVEEFKYLKKDVKEKLIRDLWLDLNESNGAEWRKTVEIAHTVKIVDEILHNPNNNYDFTNPTDRQWLNTDVGKKQSAKYAN